MPSDWALCALSVERRRGHAINPITPYMRTEPGAPDSALAVPVSTPPRPSPKNQTPKAQTKLWPVPAGRAEKQQSDADQDLNCGEESVPHADVRRDEVTDRGDEPADRFGLTRSVGGDVGRDKLVAEHEGLVLEPHVDEPEGTRTICRTR